MLNKNFKKKHIIDSLSEKTGFSKNFTKKVVNDLLEIFIEHITNSQLNLKNFGTFKTIKKRERLGRNPKTKKEFLISPRKSVSFRPSNSNFFH